MMESAGVHVTLIPVEQVTTDGNTNDYYERKAAGICTYAGCRKRACDDNVLCRRHREEQRARNRRSQNAKRAARRAAGLCPRCGKDAAGDYMCGACRVRYSRTKTARRGGDDGGEHNTKAARIAARMIAWENSPTNTGRKRLRGGKRGRKSVESIDVEDLGNAERALRLGTEGMAYAAQLDKADPSVRIPKVQREDTRNQALAKLVEAGRWIVEVVKRHGYEVPIVIDDD